jgi:hypothetical protein
MWNNKFQIIFLLIIIIIILNISYESYVSIPFKIYREDEPSIYTTIEDYFTCQSDLKYYGYISMGEKQVKIPIIFSFDDFGFYFVTNGTNIGNVDKTYIPKESPSCKMEKFSYLFFKSYQNATKANDTFSFNIDNGNPLKCESIRFLYAFMDNKKKNSFLMVGLRLIGDLIRDSELNLVQQLKKNKYTDTYDWSIHYDEKNPENEGVLLIGTQPHNYKPEKYDENSYFNSVTMSKELYGIWYIQFDKIYFVNKGDQIEITDFMKFSLVHKSGIIAGTKSYEKIIKTHFFDSFISKNKCYMETSKLNSRVYICKNNEPIKNELKSKFPPLKMEHKAFMKTFELTYDDLFKEKGDKIYFLIYFSYYQASTWEVGLPFLKKYFFNYNYDSKLIYYYNNEAGKIGNNEIEKEGNGKIKFIVIIGLIFVVTILGFYFGRKYVSMKVSQKISAKELENEFSKHIDESGYQPPINENENSKYRLI